jgi:hypothetical protein
MRHRGESGAAKGVMSGVTGTFSKLTELLSEEQATAGKHKLPAEQPLIPTQKVPTHESMGTTEAEVEEVDAVGVTDAVEETEVVEVVEIADAPQVAEVSEVTEEPELAPQVAPVQRPAGLPNSVQWKASHGPRIFAAAMLLFAVAGTSALGLRYAESRSTDEFISVVIGVGVVVALWALLIASTPQVVSLRGSILTVRNSSGSERFDLADGLQPVDVVGEPRSSQWALLLHRSNNTSVVLRRRDVDAVALDPIVRHYRAMAAQRYGDRQVRFSR